MVDMKVFVAQALLEKVRIDANTAKFLPLLAFYLGDRTRVCKGRISGG